MKTNTNQDTNAKFEFLVQLLKEENISLIRIQEIMATKEDIHNVLDRINKFINQGERSQYEKDMIIREYRLRQLESKVQAHENKFSNLG